MFSTKSLKHISSRKYLKLLLCTISKQKNFIITESHAEYGLDYRAKKHLLFFHFAVIISTKIISWKSGQTETPVVIKVGE